MMAMLGKPSREIDRVAVERGIRGESVTVSVVKIKRLIFIR